MRQYKIFLSTCNVVVLFRDGGSKFFFDEATDVLSVVDEEMLGIRQLLPDDQ